MAHHKRGRASNVRAGCKMCKPWKVNGIGRSARTASGGAIIAAGWPQRRRRSAGMRDGLAAEAGDPHTGDRGISQTDPRPPRRGASNRTAAPGG
jgi:hypothetical protein